MRLPVAGAIAVLVLRAIAAAIVPLTGDEAYYWEWSRHLAFGYADHPPMIAWSIAVWSWLGHVPTAVRLSPWLYGVVAAIAAYDFVAMATRDRVAGAWAAFVTSCVPIAQLTFGLATPDAPYLAAWLATLACAQRALRSNRLHWWIVLGLALAVTLLSRVMAIALLVGVITVLVRAIAQRRIPLRGPALALAIAFAGWLPFLWWNATHEWATFAFAVAGRHHVDGVNPVRVVMYVVFVAAVCWFGASVVALRVFARHAWDEPWAALTGATALPLAALLVVLSAFETVEVYWAAAAAITLLLGGIIADRVHGLRLGRAATRGAAINAALTLCVLALLLVPIGSTVRAATWLDPHLRLESALEPFAYAELVDDVHQRFPHVVILTDGYGFSSVLDFYGGFAPHVVGYNTQGAQTRFWENRIDGVPAIFLDKVPIARRPDLRVMLHRACASVTFYPPLVYRIGATTIHTFYPFGCSGLTLSRLLSH